MPFLTNKERRALFEALTDAIPDNDSLEVFVYMVAGRPADQVAPAGTLPARVTRFLVWAEANGELDTVIAVALERAPNNPKVKALVPRPVPSVVMSSSLPVSDAPMTSDVTAELYESLERLQRAVGAYRDTAFRAVRLLRRVRVRGQDAYLEYEETVENLSGHPCAELVRFIASDSPTDFDNLEFHSELEFPGEAPRAAAVRHSALQGGRLFRVRVGFRDKLVEPGGTLTMRSFCTLRSSVARNDDYFVFPFMFARPAREMNLEVQFDAAPAEIHLFRAVEQDARPALRAVPLPRATSLPDVPGGALYRVELPDAFDTYLFTWTARDHA